MRRAKTSLFLFLFPFLILCSLQLPQSIFTTLQGSFVGITSPFLQPAHMLKNRWDPLPISDNPLQLENQLLRNAVALLEAQLEVSKTSLPHTKIAKVIYRPLSTWSHILWIDLGKKNGEGIVQKNSPVVVGKAVVGVIDSVGNRKSRVRLISDPQLTPSVRVIRGDKYLAKGEINGATKEGTLLGTGFNYDFADRYGPARDLRNGTPFSEAPSSPTPLIQEGDLLLTTGMDGIFPPALKVGEVTKVYPLQGGDMTYTIEASIAAASLPTLSVVSVLPPLPPEDF